MEDFINDVEQPGPSSKVGVEFSGGGVLEGGFMIFFLNFYYYFFFYKVHNMTFLSDVNVSTFTAI